MLNYILKRLLGLVAVMLGVSIMTFALIRLAPGEPAEMIAIANYGQENITYNMVEQIRKEQGLDEPLIFQYVRWLGVAIKGDLGVSLTSGEPVVEEIKARLPATLKLAVSALLLSSVLSVLLGVFLALHYNSTGERLINLGAMFSGSMPCFWLALILIIIFSVKLGWLPSFGAGDLSHVVLPTLSLSIGMVAVTARMTRSSMLDVLHQDYIMAAKAKGIGKTRLVGHHALKNAMLPIVTVMAMQFAHLLEGTVIIESIFGWPGIGKLLVDSIFSRDYSMIQGCVLLFAILVVATNLIVDIIYFTLDPRIRPKRT